MTPPTPAPFSYHPRSRRLRRTRSLMLRWRVVLTLLAALDVLAARPLLAACSCADEFALRSVGPTTIQIALAWEPVANATAYLLERSESCDFTSPTTYTLSSAVTGYGDTGKAPDAKLRFHAPSGLAPGVTYYYRVRARFADQSERVSNCVAAALANGPVRGVAGDLWADVVLGQPDFAENAFRKTTAQATQWAGGLVIDRSRTPARLYVADTNHNRVLGLELHGECTGAGTDLALGKPYAKSLAPSPSYPDSGLEFTDGQLSGPWSSSSDSFGYPHPVDAPLTIDLDVDLGVPATFNAVSLNSGALTDRYTAESLDVLVSADGQQWTQAGHADNPASAFTLTLAFAPVTGRYVRFSAHARTGCVDCDWLFLGEGEVRQATAAGQPCAIDADCGAGGVCTLAPAPAPAVVLGQPGFTDAAGCNFDGTGQTYPARAPAAASSLCLIHPLQLTIAETISGAFMATDTQGSLYVPDLFNHRVLQYRDPFGANQVADEVWGQTDFGGNECNRGGGPSAGSLCLAGSNVPHAGVALDAGGNLWVADGRNARVLRFPKVGGGIAKLADVVLGQSSLGTSLVGGAGRTLDQMAYPVAVAFDPVTQSLYVSDGGVGPDDSRILEFRAPFSSGMAAVRALPVSFYCDFAYPGLRPGALALDTQIHGLWVQNTCFFTELFDLDTPGLDPVIRVMVLENEGADVDAHGDLYVIGKMSDLYRFRRSGLGLDHTANDGARDVIFPGGRNPPTPDAFYFNAGVSVLGSQLIVADSHRLLVWNDYDVGTARDGQPADDLYGETSFETETFQQTFAYLQTVDGRLWVQRTIGGQLDLLVFDPPISNTSVPAETVPLTPAGAFAGYPVLGCPGDPRCNCAGDGCAADMIFAQPGDQLDFTVSAGADEVWVADRWNSRVFRIANRLGQRDPGRGPFVDIVLGQADLAGTECNRGTGPFTLSAASLCTPYDVTLDAHGNLFVADNGGEAGSNDRLLEFDASALVFEADETVAKFGLAATRVFGTGGDLTHRGEDTSRDPLISPFKPVFDSHGSMIVGNNPYSTERFPAVYLSPLAETLPQLVLGDFLSYPAGSSYVDAQGNLYLTDTNWSRLLIYKQPFKRFALAAPPSCASGVALERAKLVVTHNLDPAGDERIAFGATLPLAAPAPAIDPVASGLTFAATTQGNGVLVTRVLPRGAAASPRAPGWRRSGNGQRWTFKDPGGMLAEGITAASVTYAPTATPPRLKLWAKGRDADFHVAPGAVPVTLVVVLADGGGPAPCGTLAFDAPGGTRPVCTLANGNDTLTCR